MSAIVFDLDGTLIHSAPDIHAAVSKMLENERLKSLDYPKVLSFVGDGVPVLVSRVMAELELEQDPDHHSRMVATLVRHYNEEPATLSKPYPGVENALAALANAGHRLAVCTNKPEAPAVKILKQFGLDQYFEYVAGGDTFPERKPNPRPLRETFSKIGAETGIFVGDSEVDCETARRADCTFFLFSEGYRKTAVDKLRHKATFASFASLPSLVTEQVTSKT